MEFYWTELFAEVVIHIKPYFLERLSDTLSLAVEKSTTDTNEPIEKPEDAAKEATEPSEI